MAAPPPARSGPHVVVVAGGALVAGALAMTVVFVVAPLVAEYWPWIVGVLTVALLLAAGGAVLLVMERRERRRRAERLRELAHLERVDVMTGAQFEELTAELLRRDGFRAVQVVGRAGDRGVDVTALTGDGVKVAVQCKRQQKTVGADRVRNLIGAVHSTYRGHVGVLVTNSTFTRHALDEADGTLVLVDRDALARWMDGEPLAL
ncbi:restriction endonuclease [Actinomadura rugatobispora]|uniref:Restriction endonuclease n=1 Tax=Actinomadura rugatobispora TaxID=1994 RepID=A0ABW0ZSZ6_9ACTN|nr:hypothetical protein GCM10010200_023910 [Actinomadura rugatobispora]